MVVCAARGTLVVDGDAEASDTGFAMTQPSYAGGAASHLQAREGVLSATSMWFRGPLIVGCAGMEASSYGLEPVRQPVKFSCSSTCTACSSNDRTVLMITIDFSRLLSAFSRAGLLRWTVKRGKWFLKVRMESELTAPSSLDLSEPTSCSIVVHRHCSTARDMGRSDGWSQTVTCARLYIVSRRCGRSDSGIRFTCKRSPAWLDSISRWCARRQI
jgi:hypothetical protein